MLPPVERLCDPIEGTDRAHIAECLGKYFVSPSLHNLTNELILVGLDASKFQSAPTAGSQERDFVSFASLISDKERFRDADPFLLECKDCHGTFEFTNMRFGKVSLAVAPLINCLSIAL